jgi:hypothetical protein
MFVLPVPPPPDHDQRVVIDQLALRTACDPSFEDLIKTKESQNPKFAFLFTGQENAMSGYYLWKKYCIMNNILPGFFFYTNPISFLAFRAARCNATTILSTTICPTARTFGTRPPHAIYAAATA